MSAADTFGYVLGAISIVSLMYATIRRFFPSNQIKRLDRILEATRQDFHEALRRGALVDPGFVSYVQLELMALEDRRHIFRLTLAHRTSLIAQVRESMNGTSTEIMVVARETQKIRVEVANVARSNLHIQSSIRLGGLRQTMLSRDSSLSSPRPTMANRSAGLHENNVGYNELAHATYIV